MGRLHTVLASPDQWLDKELMGPGCQTSKELMGSGNQTSKELMGSGNQTSKELMGPGNQTSKEQGELVQQLQEVVEDPQNKQEDMHAVHSNVVLQVVWSYWSELDRGCTAAWERLYQLAAEKLLHKVFVMYSSKISF